MQSATPSGLLFIKEPTTGFAPACFRLQGGRLSQSSHVGNQQPQPQHEREDSNPMRQFWRLTALPGAHSCECAHGMPHEQRESLFQLNCPVRVADELGPAVDPHSVRAVQRLPDRPHRFAANVGIGAPDSESRSAFFAVQRSTHASTQFSQVDSAFSREHVAGRGRLGQFLAAGLLTAVLAGEPVTLEDVPSAESSPRSTGVDRRTSAR